MGFSIKTDIPLNMRKVLTKLNPNSALQAGALELGGLISDAADKGKGTRGGFKQYSPFYRKKHGKPDLQDSGELMRNVIQPVLKYKKFKGGYRVTITLPTRAHTDSNVSIERLGQIQQRTRPFWGVTKRYGRIIKKVVIRELEKNYGKLNLN